MESKSGRKEFATIEEFVDDVIDFSSQYGSDGRVSYTALNLLGRPSNFPEYGDFPQSFAMRTYGNWWRTCPSAVEEFMPQNSVSVISEDFVEISFLHHVFASELSLFENYNPGALVRVWGMARGDWYLLWEGPPQTVPRMPRIFTPKLRKIYNKISTVRLEFNQSHLEYYTQIDAVRLMGTKEAGSLNFKHSGFSYRPQAVGPFPQPIIERSGLMQSLMELGMHETVQTFPRHSLPDIPGPPMGAFHNLPEETLLYILSLLDMKSLSRCAVLNRRFNMLACDPILYRSISLKPYWHCVRSVVLTMLSDRCRLLQKLDLSWCGNHNYIDHEHFTSFLLECGYHITHLRLNSCKFVLDRTLQVIVKTCPSLQELGVRCSIVQSWSALCQLSNLRRLDAYRTAISTDDAVRVIRNNPHLQHVNFGACPEIHNMDRVMHALGECCADLRSVDVWKSQSLTPSGVKALARCTNLEEIDIGWCLQSSGTSEWVRWLGAGGGLRKVFAGAVRGLAEAEVRAWLPRLPRLRQLDLFGVRAVTADLCLAILAQCPELEMLDVSFCQNIKEAEVLEWRKMYPHVSIKLSYQAPGILKDFDT